jgi:hypothetical protein
MSTATSHVDRDAMLRRRLRVSGGVQRRRAAAAMGARAPVPRRDLLDCVAARFDLCSVKEGDGNINGKL